MGGFGERVVSAVATLISGTTLAVALSNFDVESFNSTATYTLTGTGEVQANGIAVDTWLISGLSSQAEVFFELLSGTLAGGVTNAWQPLSTGRFVGSNNATLRVSIRQVGTVTPLTTAIITLVARYGGGGGGLEP